MPGLLLRYRVLAYATGIVLAFSCCVELPLQYLAGIKALEPIWILHGFLYIAYLLSVIELTIRLRWNPLWVVAVGAAGTVPFMSFVAEHFVTPKARSVIDRPAATATAADMSRASQE